MTFFSLCHLSPSSIPHPLCRKKFRGYDEKQTLVRGCTATVLIQSANRRLKQNTSHCRRLDMQEEAVYANSRLVRMSDPAS